MAMQHSGMCVQVGMQEQIRVVTVRLNEILHIRTQIWVQTSGCQYWDQQNSLDLLFIPLIIASVLCRDNYAFQKVYCLHQHNERKEKEQSKFCSQCWHNIAQTFLLKMPQTRLPAQENQQGTVWQVLAKGLQPGLGPQHADSPNTHTLRPTATGSSSGDLYISGQQSPSTTRIRCKIWEHIWKGSAVTEGCTDSKHFFSFLLSHWWVWRSCLSSTLGRGCAPHCPH